MKHQLPSIVNRTDQSIPNALLLKLQAAIMKQIAVDLIAEPISIRIKTGSSDDLLPTMQQFQAVIDSNDDAVILIHGAAGSGKTQLCYQLINHYKELLRSTEGRIPIYLDFAHIDERDGDIITRYFQKLSFTNDEINYLRTQCRFLVFLDGFDEWKRGWENPFHTFKFAGWQAQCVFTCRSTYLLERRHYKLYLTELDRESQRWCKASTLVELQLAPLTIDQVFSYFTQQLIEDQAYQWLQEHTLVHSLLTTPLMAVKLDQLLSQLLSDNIGFTENQLRSELLMYWWQYHQQKLSHRGVMISVDALKTFAIHLARAMQERGQLDFYHQVTDDLFSKQSNHLTEFCQSDSDTRWLRWSCPLTTQSLQKYRFIDELLLTELSQLEVKASYAAAEDKVQVETKYENIAEPLQKSADSNFELNEKLLVDDVEVISFCADRVIQDPQFKESLLSLLQSARNNDNMTIAAANAITILNWAGVPLMNLDLSGLRIPKADLSRAMLAETKLDNADLTDVKFHRACLRRTSMQDAILLNANFGELPFWKINGQLRKIIYHPSLPLLAMIVDCQGKDPLKFPK